MATPARIEIRFDSQPASGCTISFTLNERVNDVVVASFKEVAVNKRLAPNEFEIGSTITETVENFKTALLADYGEQSVSYSIITTSFSSINNDTLRVTAYDYGFRFYPANDYNCPSTTHTTFEDDTIGPIFAITDYESQPPQNNPVCDYQRIKLTVENATYPCSIAYDGQSKTGIADAAGLWIEIPRNALGDITVTDDTGAQDTITPNKIASWQIADVDVSESLSGATVAINVEAVTSGNNLSKEYSLNGTDWKSSNSFTGLLAGSYTAYARDSFNCVKTQSFTVEGLETPRPDPLLTVEKANPLRFVDAAEPTFRNVENTLYNNQNIPNLQKYFFRQPFEIGTVVNTQIKSSYRDLTAKIYDDCTGEMVQQITPEKKISNIGQKDKRDCRITGNLSTAKAQIFFPQGDIYEPGTTTVINNYFLRGRLPLFAKVGILVTISNVPDFTTGYPWMQPGTYEVKDILYNEDIGYWVMEIDATIEYPPGSFGAICESVYNAELFDVFEFSFSQNQGQYRAEIEATDTNSNFTDLLYKSEPFLFDNFDNIVHINYYSEDNQSGINYQTGIQYMLNVPARFFNYSQAGDDETFEDDYGNKQIQKAVYIKQLELQTGLIPAWLAEKIVIASTHENLKINGLSVTMSDRPEVENMSEEQNPLYTLSGIYELENKAIRDERTGVISSSRAVVGADNDNVLGV